MATTSIMIGEDSISGSLQGVEIKTFDQLYQGMMPKIRPLNSPILVVGNKRIDNLKIFDEALSTDISTQKIEQFPNFERDELTFGFADEYKKDTIFNDIPSYNPVSFLQISSTEKMFPSVLDTESYHDILKLDGVIEPLTIRSIVDMTSIDAPFIHHSIKGTYSNAGEDVRKRSNPIVDYVFPVDLSVEPYLDETFGQDSLGVSQPGYLSAPSDLSVPFNDGTDWEDVAAELEGELSAVIINNTTSTEQMFPRGAISSTCGQVVDLKHSPGTDSTTFAGMKIDSSSGIISLPAKLKLKEIDDNPGSYSTVKRTGDSRRGTLKSNFDDNSAITFSEQVVNFPAMLPSSSAFNSQTTIIFGQDSDITSSVSVRSHQQPNFLHYSPTENVGPFDDRDTRSTTEFFMSGTDPRILPGFTAPMRSKVSIEIDITPATNTKLTRNANKRNIRESITPGPDNTGFMYYNFDRSEWEQIGSDPTYDYAYNANVGFRTGSFPMQFVQSPHRSMFSNSGDPLVGYDKIGMPTIALGAPANSKYHAVRPQCLKLSNHISSPFLLEAIVVEFDNVNAQRINGLVEPSSHNSSISDVFKSGSVRDIDNYVFFIYRQQRNNRVIDSADDILETQRFIVATGSMTFWNSSSLYNSELRHSPAFSHEYGLPYTDNYNVGAYTGSISMNLRPTVSAPQFLSFSNVINENGIATKWIFNSWPGGNSTKKTSFDSINTIDGIRSYPDSNNFVLSDLISQNSLDDSRSHRRFGPNNISHITESVNSPDPIKVSTFTDESVDSAYLLFPNDELVFGLEAGVGPSPNYVKASNLTGSFLQINNKRCKVTLIGSLIKEQKEFFASLNQDLSSNSIHESLGSEAVLDQFEIESQEAYYGSYLDEIVSGKLVEYNPSSDQYITFGQESTDARKVVSRASVGQAGITGSFQRFASMQDANERIYDSCLPSFEEYLENDASFSKQVNDKIMITVNSPFIHEETGLLSAQFPYEKNPTRNAFISLKDYELKSDFTSGYQAVILPNDNAITSIIYRTKWKRKATVASSNLLAHRFADYNSSETSQRPVSSGSAYRYGISSVKPQFSKIVWRTNHYGFFRDIFEQRQLTANLNAEPPIKCMFYSGSTQVSAEQTVSQNLSHFSTSSIPYFDDGTSHNRDTTLLDMLEVV